MLRELMSSQGCALPSQGGGSNPLNRMVNEGAGAMSRNSQLPQFRGNGPGGHIAHMMGGNQVFMEGAAMAEAFEREMAGEGHFHMMPGPHMMPHPAMGHGGAFDEGWADDFSAGQMPMHPQQRMMMGSAGGAWAEEMMFQHQHQSRAMGMGAGMGAMGAMGGMGMIGPMRGPMMMGPKLGLRHAPFPDVRQTSRPSAQAKGGEGLEEAFKDASLDDARGETDAEGGSRWAEELGGDKGGVWADQFGEGRARNWADEFRESDRWADEFDSEGRQTIMSKALEDVLNADPELAQTSLRDFVAAINSGGITFENGSIVDSNGELWDPSSGEDAMTARPYVFRDANPYMARDDCFQAGVDMLANGQVAESITAFEAEVQKHPDNSDAWLSLGLAHAENDEDVKAIIALNRAVQADPTNLDALLALGVSHTNELEQVHALKHLQSWITSHPDYKGLVGMPKELSPGAPPHTLHNEVVMMFENASRSRPDDAELHTVLGVLYNLSYEYPKAVECFREALRINPQDYALWNKLGATLANSMRSDEAIDAYIQGLSIKPNYVRALANLGISYSNQEMYEEAAGCYLKALSMNPEAAHVWSSLRVVFNCMQAPHLAQKCELRNVEVFRGDLDF